MYLGFRKPSNNHQKLYEEGDNQKIIQGLKREKRFNSALKMFMRNQRRLPNSSTTKSSVLTSIWSRNGKYFRIQKTIQTVLLKSNNLKILKNVHFLDLAEAIYLRSLLTNSSQHFVLQVFFFWKTTHLIYLVI